jgi:5-methylcytosine-specific restriction endonuclease McrA
MGRGPRIYDRRVWRDRVAPGVLAEEPLCRMCAAAGVVTPATVVDHVIPVRVRPELAFERSNLQALCKGHHDSAKRQQEHRGYHAELDARGYPLDPAHPTNMTRCPATVTRCAGGESQASKVALATALRAGTE